MHITQLMPLRRINSVCHPSYNKGVLDYLVEFSKAAEGSKTTEGSKTALEFLRNLTQDLKETIKNNPETQK